MDGENRENLIKIDDLGVPLFLETPIFEYGWPSKNRGVLYTQIIHLFIGLSMKNSPSILGVPVFLETPIYITQLRTGWWLNQPIWKVCSMLVKLDPSSPGMKVKNIWKHHLEKDKIYGEYQLIILKL